MNIVPVANIATPPIEKAAFACNIIKQKYLSWSTKYSVANSGEGRGRVLFTGSKMSKMHGQIGYDNNKDAITIANTEKCEKHQFFQKFSPKKVYYKITCQLSKYI